MWKKALRVTAILAIIGIALFSCQGTATTGDDAKGELVISFAKSSLSSKGLYPTEELALSSWNIILTKSGSPTIIKNGISPSTTSYAAAGLDVGTWEVTIDGLNSSNNIIATGSQTALIEDSKSTNLTITLSLLTGNGTLAISASWSYGLTSPIVEGTLIPSSGGAATSFAMTTDSGKLSASYTGSVAAGSYLLNLALSDSGIVAYRSNSPIAVLIAASCTTPGSIVGWVATSKTVTRIIDHSYYNPDLIAYSDAEITAAATLDVYFEHASVGQDIVGNSTSDTSAGVDHAGSLDCGLHLIYDMNNRYLCSRYSWTSNSVPTWWASHDGLGDNHRGNPGASSKISGFQTDMTTTLAAALDVAMFKFCYIDNPSDATTAASLFDTAKSVMEGLESQYPSVSFVWWTMPITSSSYSDSTASRAARATYNGLVRTYCKANSKWLLDVADLESHDASGNAITYDGSEALYTSYASDAAHLNAAGKLKMAMAYWTLLAEIAKTK